MKEEFNYAQKNSAPGFSFVTFAYRIIILNKKYNYVFYDLFYRI